MFKRQSIRFLVICLFVVLSGTAFAAEVKEVAPGVYFRLADKWCNVGWVTFEDYVLVIDATVPEDVENVLEDIRETTDKPIRFVFNTHHHWDHAFGNALFAKEGAAIVAQKACAKQLNDDREQFKKWISKKPEYADLEYVMPAVQFDEYMVFSDGKRTVELLHLGHAHTKGDAVAYLPNEKILFTGDVCVNGAYNYMGEARLNQWINVLDYLQGLEVKTICPGHGKMAKPSLLETQKRYFIELRDQVQAAVDKGKSLEETIEAIHIPMFKDWTGEPPRESNIKQVYRDLTGLNPPWDVLEHADTWGISPTKDTPGWTPPKKLLVNRVSDEQLANLKIIAPDLEIVEVSRGDVLEEIEDADGLIGGINEEQLAKAKNLRWVHSSTAGVERYLFPEFIESDVVLTNGQGMMGPAIADHVMGMILMLTKALAIQHKAKLEKDWGQVPGHPMTDLDGKTMLILGLGGIGSEVAERAYGFGMRVKAIDPAPIEKPRHVAYIGNTDELNALIPEADVVVSTVPHTKHTHRYFGKEQFDLMKETSIFANVGRGNTVRQEDLVDALKNESIRGACLDVTDPEPLPKESPLWEMDNVVLTPHMSARTYESYHRRWLLMRENIRRFAVGEPLLNVVNKKAGY